ncbi:MAG: signal peptide peptidase SppA [Bdellovibrionales bacterium]|nr:signal peptide peptidase SppA [Bdellovibrionales bacterium]
MKKFFIGLFIVVAVFIVMGFFVTIGSVVTVLNPPEQQLHKSSILLLNLDGVIEDGEKFLDKLRRYRKDENIKGVLVHINSPGGVVGPSQEIYMELKRTREQFKKPVVVSCLGVAASGAYYAAVAANKIVVTPGCMIGSIGVIMQFANLEKLFEWAKVQRYALTTGPFKDTGAEYRSMKKEERAVLQELLDDVLDQFKEAIASGRKLKPELVTKYADGRVFTGRMAVKLGLADQVGTMDDARKLIGKLTGLGDSPELFKPRDHREFNLRSLLEEESKAPNWKNLAEDLLRVRLRGQLLSIWPGALGL